MYVVYCYIVMEVNGTMYYKSEPHQQHSGNSAPLSFESLTFILRPNSKTDYYLDSFRFNGIDEWSYTMASSTVSYSLLTTSHCQVQRLLDKAGTLINFWSCSPFIDSLVVFRTVALRRTAHPNRKQLPYITPEKSIQAFCKRKDE